MGTFFYQILVAFVRLRGGEAASTSAVASRKEFSMGDVDQYNRGGGDGGGDGGDLQDKIINCRDCSKDFTFTVGEQEFYKEKGFENEPNRCKVTLHA